MDLRACVRGGGGERRRFVPASRRRLDSTDTHGGSVLARAASQPPSLVVVSARLRSCSESLLSLSRSLALFRARPLALAHGTRGRRSRDAESGATAPGVVCAREAGGKGVQPASRGPSTLCGGVFFFWGGCGNFDTVRGNFSGWWIGVDYGERCLLKFGVRRGGSILGELDWGSIRGAE